MDEPNPDANASDPRAARADTSEAGARWFVWAFWLAMTCAAFAFVARYGPQVPLGDDYAIVPVWTGDRSLTLAWLWSTHNEHRLPIPRFVLWAAFRLSGGEVRAGMFVTTGCLSIAAAVLISAARRARGAALETDALFALLLLHVGHWNNLLWSWQVQFGLSTLLIALLAGRFLGRSEPSNAQLQVSTGTALALLPLCGANGLAMAPGLALWLMLWGLSAWRRGDRAFALRVGLALLPGLVVLGALMLSERPQSPVEPSSDPAAIARTALQVLAIGLGPVVQDRWPLFGGAVLGFGIMTGLGLVLVAIRSERNRLRATGLLAILIGFGVLTLGLAWGRAEGGPTAGLEDRYVTLTAPLTGLCALAWIRFGPQALARFFGASILAVVFLLSWSNSRVGLEAARLRKAQADAVEQDLKSGVPLSALIRRHTPYLHVSHEPLTRCLPMLKRAGVPPFDQLQLDPPWREIPLELEPTATRLAEWDSATKTIEATGVDPWVTFRLPERLELGGIRIRYDHENASGTPARFKLSWWRDDQSGFPLDQEYAPWVLPTGADQSTTVWIREPIDAFRIQPDNKPCRFRIASITLLAPVSDGGE